MVSNRTILFICRGKATLHYSCELNTQYCVFTAYKGGYGCRHYNPNICKNNGMENICAFVKADNICKKPPRSWTKQYEKLSKKDSS